MDQFLYGCFLDYRRSLNLGRWLSALIQLCRLLADGKLIREQIGDAAAHNARALFPELRPTGCSHDDFVKTRIREKRWEAFSEDEKTQEIEAESERLRAALDSGELDVWDDTPRFIEPGEAGRFVEDSLRLLSEKILPACNPSVSWLEKTTVEVLELLATSAEAKTLRAREAILCCWDQARIQHEGEPPYKIVFSRQVEEFLGIDGKLESARLDSPRSLSRQDIRRFSAARKIAGRLLPSEEQNLLAMAKTCDIA